MFFCFIAQIHKVQLLQFRLSTFEFQNPGEMIFIYTKLLGKT